MLNKLSLFPTLVTVTKNFITTQQAADIRDYLLSSNSLNPHGLLVGEGYSTYKEDSDFLGEVSKNIAGCQNLKNDISNLLSEYSMESGLLHKVIDRSWANYQKKNSELKKHTHPCSTITGALYISVKTPTSLILHNPNNFISWTALTDIATEYTKNYYSINPEIGMVVLFPSWLSHSSNKSMDDERIVISFNSGLR
jgi:uncharacterized protein (TIGR02466 family)